MPPEIAQRMEDERRARLIEQCANARSIRDLPDVESMLLWQVSETFEYKDPDLMVDTFSYNTFGVLHCPHCGQLHRIEYLECCGTSSRDRDRVDCPSCGETIGQLYSVGHPSLRPISGGYSVEIAKQTKIDSDSEYEEF